MTSALQCPECKGTLSPTAPLGLCSKCLLQNLLDPPLSQDDSLQESQGISGERIFAGYELIEVIARGGMGVVYRARQPRLNRIVALKMIRAGEFASEAERKRFHAEAEAAAHLEHPNIVPIYEIGEQDGQDYFSMKLIEGSNLAQLLKHQASPITSDPESAAKLLATVARAVHYAHQRGVLHRDLKPGNILIDTQGEPFVTDFGLAKRVESSLDLTLSGAVLGTPNYMPPEQAAGGSKEITTSADIYSLGAILYELLAGRPPFQADSPLATMRKVMEEEPVRPRLVRGSGRDEAKYAKSQVPFDLETICLKCLEKDPQRRYVSGEALAEDLERWLRQEPIQARPIGMWEIARKWAKRHPSGAGLLLLAVAAPLTIIVLLVVSGGRVRKERNYANERAYAADIYAAFQALAVDDLALARSLLREYQPPRMAVTEHGKSNRAALPVGAPSRLKATASDTDHLRGFEWHVLWERARGQEAFAFTNLSLPATCLAFTPDGSRLVSGGDDGVYVWDFVGRKPIGLFPGSDPGPTDGNVSPTENDLRPMLNASPAVVAHLRARPDVLDYLDALGHTNRTRTVLSVTFTPNGEHLLVGSSDYVRCWNFEKREFAFGVPEERSTVAIPGVDDLFLVANDSREANWSAHRRSALLYSFSQQRVLAELPGYGRKAVISPDGKQVAATAWTNRTVLWRPFTSEAPTLLTDLKMDGPLAFSPDSKMLLVGADSQRPAHLRDVESKQIISYLQAEHVQITTAAWSSDGRWLAGGGKNQNIGLWASPSGASPSSGTPLFVAPRFVLHGHEDSVTALAFSPDGRWLVSASEDHSIRAWIIPEDSPVAQLELNSHYNNHFLTDPETGAVIMGPSARFALRSPADGYMKQHKPAPERHVAAGFLSRGRGLVVVEMGTNGLPTHLEIRRSTDGALITRRETLPVPNAHQARGSPKEAVLAADPNGQWLALLQSSPDRVQDVHVFNIETGSFLARLPGWPRSILWGLRSSPDGRWLASLSHYLGESRITIYETRGWQMARQISFRSGDYDVVAAAIDPTSRFIATGGIGENSLRISDLLTGRVIAHCNGSVRGSNPVWSPDGRTLVVRDGDSIRFWSMVVFRELAALPLDWHDILLPLGFTADGRTLVSFSREGREARIKAWRPGTYLQP